MDSSSPNGLRTLGFPEARIENHFLKFLLFLLECWAQSRYSTYIYFLIEITERNILLEIELWFNFFLLAIYLLHTKRYRYSTVFSN